MKSDKRQTLVLIGVALLVVAGVLIYIALNQPKVYKESTSAKNAAYTYKESAQSGKSGKSGNNGSSSSAKASDGINVEYPLNLNTATLEELETIDGIGEARASAILEYRDYLGGYSSVSQIKDISGISDSLYSQVAGYLTV